MADQKPKDAGCETGEFYRVSFIRVYAEIALQYAKLLHARTLDGNPLIPPEAHGFGERSEDVFGKPSISGFQSMVGVTHKGFSIDITRNGEIAGEGPGNTVPKFIDKKEADQWNIEITAPGNLHRDFLIEAFGQSFGKELKKEDFHRQPLPDGEVPMQKITLNVGTLLNAPSMHMLQDRSGDRLMVTAKRLAELESKASQMRG